MRDCITHSRPTCFADSFGDEKFLGIQRKLPCHTKTSDKDKGTHLEKFQSIKIRLPKIISTGLVFQKIK